MEPVIETTQSELADALTEWERRWREDPAKFQSDTERLAGTSEEYGVGAAAYLVEILAEQRDAGRMGEETAATHGEVARKAAGL